MPASRADGLPPSYGVVLGRQRQILDEAHRRGVILRLLGGAAVLVHCPSAAALFQATNRALPDLDLMAYRTQLIEAVHIFRDLGYEEDETIKRLYGTQRRIFVWPGDGFHVDLFFDRLRFCHELDLGGRLELDSPTLSLADLLLHKLQIVELNLKDVTDLAALLLDHELGEPGSETIDLGHIARICGADWGFWRTATANLQRLPRFVDDLVLLQTGQREKIANQVGRLCAALYQQPKTLRWKLRARVGERVPWYQQVEEVRR